MVKRVVDFDSIKESGVMLEPFALGQTGWIKQFLPVLVIPTGRADSNIAILLVHRNILTR